MVHAHEGGGHLCYFLLVYDAQEGQLISQEQFDDVAKAMDAFGQAEWEHRNPEQVLLFSADSIETVRQTHPHYFGMGDGDWGLDLMDDPRIPA